MPRPLPLAIALLALPAAALAQEADPAAVPLDRLFKLPAAAPSPSSAEEADRERWRERFAAQHRDLRLARENLASSQRQLEELAEGSDSWQITAPGANPSPENSPLSYKLRQDIRRQREEVDRAERALRDLEVEASLAGVPAEWRRPPEPEGEPLAAGEGEEAE